MTVGASDPCLEAVFSTHLLAPLWAAVKICRLRILGGVVRGDLFTCFANRTDCEIQGGAIR